MTLTGRHIELIGIGGCGMSGLARVLHARGAKVSGSDKVPSPITQSLQRDGIEVTTDQTLAGLRPDIDLIIATANALEQTIAHCADGARRLRLDRV